MSKKVKYATKALIALGKQTNEGPLTASQIYETEKIRDDWFFISVLFYFLTPYPFTFFRRALFPLPGRTSRAKRPGVKELNEQVFAGFCMKVNMGFQVKRFPCQRSEIAADHINEIVLQSFRIPLSRNYRDLLLELAVNNRLLDKNNFSQSIPVKK